jgi:hypothetical protein
LLTGARKGGGTAKRWPHPGQARTRRKSVRRQQPPEADELGRPHPTRLRLLRQKWGRGLRGAVDAKGLERLRQRFAEATQEASRLIAQRDKFDRVDAEVAGLFGEKRLRRREPNALDEMVREAERERDRLADELCRAWGYCQTRH